MRPDSYSGAVLALWCLIPTVSDLEGYSVSGVKSAANTGVCNSYFMSLKQVEPAARFHDSGWWVVPFHSSLGPSLVPGVWGNALRSCVLGGGSDLVSTHSQLIPSFKSTGS